MVNWVEKSVFKNIQKLLEISEREQHHEILLTVKNLRELSRNLSPYTLPVIPRPLPTKIVEGEPHVIADLLNLVPGSSSPTQSFETEVVGQELAISLRPEQPSLAREDPDVAPRASKEVNRGSHLKCLPFKKKGSRPAPQASKKGRRLLERRRGPGTRVEDFVPWFAPVSSLPPASEDKEEEDEMADLIHNFGVRKRKQGASFTQATDATSEVVGRLINTQLIEVRKSRQ